LDLKPKTVVVILHDKVLIERSKSLKESHNVVQTVKESV